MSTTPIRPPRVVFGRTVRVFFTGNQSVSTEDLRAVTHVDKAPEDGEPEHADALRDLVGRDQLFVNALYYDRGYMLVQTGEPRITEASDGPFVDVTFPIAREGPRIRITRIDVYERDEDGKVTEPLGGSSLRRFMTLGAGAWFARDVVVKDLMELRRFYRDQGYANVEAEPETELDEREAKVAIVIPVRRGPLVRIERVELVAPPDIVPTLQRELQLAEGDLFHESKLEESRRRMLAASHARGVHIATKPGSDPGKIVIVFETTR